MINEQKFEFTNSEIKELKARYNMENRKHIAKSWKSGHTGNSTCVTTDSSPSEKPQTHM